MWPAPSGPAYGSPYSDPAPTAPMPTPSPMVPVAVPAASASAPASDPILFMIGDIGITRYWVVTPNGSAPLAGSRWIGRDMSRTEQKIPGWAIVLAIIFALACLLGLLFLLVKEDRTTGYFEVTVQSGTLQHVSQLPVSDQAQLAQLRQLVYQAQSMAAAA